MDELISRKSALNALKSYCNGCDNYNGVRCGSCLIDNAIIAVDAVSSVDAVPVTRCKDCVYYEDGEHFHDMQFCCRLYAEDGTPAHYNFAPNAFCSYGETPEEKQQRETAEQDAWESMQAMCNPEDGSL